MIKIEDIYFYDFEFNLLCVEKHCISAVWSVRYNDLGAFEAVFPLNSGAVKTVLENDYVIAVQGGNQAVVTGKIISKTGTVYGKTLNWLLTKKLIAPKTLNDTFSNVLNTLSGEAMEGVENYELALCNVSDNAEIEHSDYVTFFDALKRLCDNHNLGHEVYASLSDKKWVLNILKRNATPTIISDDVKNAYNVEYLRDIQNHFTDGIYIDENDNVHTISSDKTGIYKWVCKLDESTENEAKTELDKMKISHESRAMTRNFEYKKDFNLGDELKIRKSGAGFETLTNAYVDGVNLWYDKTIFGAEPVFKEI